jgi:predicted metalloprotease with PDZ domain
VLTLNDASLLAWVKHYRPDENTGNTAISYYLKGEIVSLLLDLHIRQATKNAKSLDDVMRLLWQRHGDESGVTEEGVEKAASEVSGTDLSAFFQRAIRSTQELDYSILSYVGLEANFRERESAGDKGGTPPKNKEGRTRGWLGLSARGQTIATVTDGSPAMNGGLYVDDEVVALDGYKIDGNGLLSRCEDKKPGETVTVSVFRREKLLQVPVTLGAFPKDAVYLSKVSHPSEAQKESYRAWLKAPWDEGFGPVA